MVRDWIILYFHKLVSIQIWAIHKNTAKIIMSPVARINFQLPSVSYQENAMQRKPASSNMVLPIQSNPIFTI